MGFNSAFKVLMLQLKCVYSVDNNKSILVFKLSPCCSNDELSSGYFPASEY